MKSNILVFLIFSVAFINCQNKTLVLFFSRPGENYDVGIVEKGNTERFVNAMKSSLPSTTTYHKIEPVNAYPESYTETLAIVKEEQNNNTRPEIQNPLTDVSDFNPIIIAYPIWYTKIPRIMINQIEKINQEGFKGKDIILVCTHGGSGFSSTKNEISEKITNSNSIVEGKSMQGKNVDSNTNEIESFAKNIANKYNNSGDSNNSNDSNGSSDSNNFSDSNDSSESKDSTVSSNSNESNNSNDTFTNFNMELFISFKIKIYSLILLLLL